MSHHFGKLLLNKSGEIKIPKFRHCVGIEVFIAVVMESSVLWDYNTV
jgi:hypothetical protein